MPTAFITHPDCLKHDMGAHHPESPERLYEIEDRLIATGLEPVLVRHEAPLASDAQLLRVHPAEYIARIRDASPAAGTVHIDPDTAMNPHTWVAALRAAGAGVLGAELVMSGAATNAFCAVRPPGHHACRAAAMGFCFFNNAAIAAMHAIDVLGAKRVAIVDFDVHHGNGTEDIFAGDPRVLMVSTFQHPFYPYSGDTPAADNMLNVPLPAGAGSRQFRDAVETRWLPALDRFRPQLVVCSAGFDAHIEDDMAMLRLVDEDYAWVTREIRQLAERHCRGRIVSMLEGGYALSALGRSVARHLRVLAGVE